MENSKIEWTTHSFNPWIGCTKVSPGCANCYAETLMDLRYGKVQWGKGKPRARTQPENWRKPRRWNKAAAGMPERPRVFCASLSDWLDDEVPIEWLGDLLTLIYETPHLDWLLLTKRPLNFYRLEQARFFSDYQSSIGSWIDGRPPANVWLGVTAEDQERWDERVTHLVTLPAVVHFVSAEPLLGPIEFQGHHVDWLIVGGESGRAARVMREEWALALRDQSLDCFTAFHFKQWGGTDKKAAGRLLDGRTWDDLPIPRVP
jgi:protein gp37